MNCLTPEEIYLYLEEELSSTERVELESHLAGCEKCWKEVEERRVFLEAVADLPKLEVPPDFTARIMMRIFQPKIPFRTWFMAFTLGFSALLASVFIYILTSARGISSIFSFFLPAAVKSGKGLSLLVKIYKLLSVTFTVIWTLLNQVWQAIKTLSSILSPEAQAFVFLITLLTLSVLIFGVRRIFAFGENK